MGNLSIRVLKSEVKRLSRSRCGAGLFSIIVFLSIISALIVSVVLYLGFSYTKRAIRDIASQIAKYAYDSAYMRGIYEIYTNPQLPEIIKTQGEYVISGFEENGLRMDIYILPDGDGDGQFDIEVKFVGPGG